MGQIFLPQGKVFSFFEKICTNHLVLFHENKMYNADAKSKVFPAIQKSGQGSTQSSNMEADIDSPESDCGENVSGSCQCTCAYSPVISNLHLHQ